MPRLTALFVEAALNGASASFNELMEYSDFRERKDDPLEAMQYLLAEAAEHQIEISPPPAKVGPNYQLVFRRADNRSPEAIGTRMKARMDGGETADLELKSTLWLNLKRRELQPDASIEDLKCPKVCNASMKTICGFLNENGGTLVIGVADDTSVVGIEEEFYVACPNDPSIDGWMQALRTAIIQFFHEANEILHQVRISHGTIDGKIVAVLEVASRRKLSLCKCGELRELKIYTRRGSSTEIVDITVAEQYITTRLARD